MIWLRVLLGIIAGIVLGIGIVAAGDMLNHRLWPPPADLQVTNPAAVGAYLETAPLAALIGLPLFWTLAAGLAALVAARIAGRAFAGWIAGGVLCAATVLNLSLIPHPAWMWAAGILGPVLAVWLASRASAPRAT